MKGFAVFLVIGCLFLLPVDASGSIQDKADTTATRAPSYVTMDEDIQMLLDVYRELVNNERGISGFRVQVFMDSGSQARLRTQRARAEFESKYPEVNAYITYDEPNFKLRVGDFRTRLDARRFMDQIAEDYPPGSVYIVLDTINFPELD